MRRQGLSFYLVGYSSFRKKNSGFVQPEFETRLLSPILLKLLYVCLMLFVGFGKHEFAGFGGVLVAEVEVAAPQGNPRWDTAPPRWPPCRGCRRDRRAGRCIYRYCRARVGCALGFVEHILGHAQYIGKARAALQRAYPGSGGYGTRRRPLQKSSSACASRSMSEASVTT